MRPFLITVASISGLAVGLAVSVGLTVITAYVEAYIDASSILALLTGIVLVPVGVVGGAIYGGMYGNHLRTKRRNAHHLPLQNLPPNDEPAIELSSHHRETKRKRRALFMVAMTTIIWAVIGLYGALSALLSVMLFDAPGSERQFGTILLAISIVLLPLTCFASILSSWVALHKDRLRVACVASFFPLAGLALILFAQCWIDHFQDGRLGE
jgi:hypothetical protein